MLPIVVGMDGLSTILDLIGQLAAIPAVLAGAAIAMTVVDNIRPDIPGPPRALAVRPIFVRLPRSGERLSLTALPLFSAVAVPGAAWWLCQSGNLANAERVAGVAVFGVSIYAAACWSEWGLRKAALERQPAYVMAVPVLAFGAYAVGCRVFGAEVVDTGAAHAGGGIIFFGIVIALLALTCGLAALVLGGAAFAFSILASPIIELFKFRRARPIRLRNDIRFD